MVLVPALLAVVAFSVPARAVDYTFTIAVDELKVNALISVDGPDLIGNAVTLVSGVVSTASTALCEVTGDDTVCLTKVISYGIATDYVRPNGTRLAKVTGGLAMVPTPVDASGDGFPDLVVTLSATSTQNVQLKVQRLLTAPTVFPVSVEALVNEPSADGDRLINLGYDARESTAPSSWKADATIKTITDEAQEETSVDVVGTITTTGPGPSLAVLGGMFVPGPGGARLLPTHARLAYTPVPKTATIGFLVGPDVQRGALSAVTPTQADLTLLLDDGEAVQRITGTLKQLQKPVVVTLDRVDEQGQPTDGEGDLHASLVTQRDVAEAALTYERTVDGIDVLRVRVRAEDLPGAVDFTQRPTGLVIDASEPITSVSGGIARGRGLLPPPIFLPPLAVPPDAPLESDNPSYVHQDSTGGVASTTFRVLGLEHVRVTTVGNGGDSVITLVGRLAQGPMDVLVTDDAEGGGTRYDAAVADVPHNFIVRLALGAKRKVEFCGTDTDEADPCSVAAQAAPRGIDRITIRPSYRPTPLFGRATDLSGEILDVPSLFAVDVTARVPEDENDPDQNTKVDIEVVSDDPIGQVLLRATDGAPAPADPADNGVIYHAQPGIPYAVVAKVDGLRRVSLDTVPELDVRLRAAPDHDATFSIKLPPTDDRPASSFVGGLTGRPAYSRFRFKSTEDGRVVIRAEGRDHNDTLATTGGAELEATGLSDDPLDKVHHVSVAVENLHGSVEVVKQPTPDGVNGVDLDLTTAGGTVGAAEVQIDNGNLPDAEDMPENPADRSFVTAFTGDGHFLVQARIRDLASFGVDNIQADETEPVIDASIDVSQPQDLRVFVDTGYGENYTLDDDGCGDFDPDENNFSHVEYHDVLIEELQPKTRFRYLTGHDGNTDLCERETARRIEYEAEGRAKTITYDTNVGNMAHLTALIGQEGSIDLRVPEQLTICQAGFDRCYERIGYSYDCDYDTDAAPYCDTDQADFSAFVNAYGQQTHLRLAYCMQNVDRFDFDTCTNDVAVDDGEERTQDGVFLELNTRWIDLGYSYSDGFGFLAMNTRDRNSGVLHRVTGGLEYIDRTNDDDGIGIGYVRLGLGYDDTAAAPPWDASQGSRWDNAHATIWFAAPLAGSFRGTADCVNSSSGGIDDPENTFFKVILAIVGGTQSPDDPGSLLTDLLCHY